MQFLIDDLHIRMTTAGWLMSIFAVAGIILAIPAAVILRKFGPKMTGILALGCSVLGAIIGALARNATTMLIGRLIEGVGLGLIAVVAPAMISIWFSPEKRGQPMGLWATWVPAGSLIIFNLANPLVNVAGWRGVWWFSGMMSFAALVCYALVVDAPSKGESAEEQTTSGTPVFYSKILFNPACWILALVFAAFNFCFLALLTWEPIFLTTVIGITPAKASFDVSIISVAAIPSCIIAGAVLNRTRRRGRILIGGMLALGLLIIWCFRLPGEPLVIPYMLVLGFLGGFVPTTVFTLAPEIAESPEFAGLVLGIVAIGQNAGMMLGPPVVGKAIESNGWGGGITPILIVMAIGLTASLFVKTASPSAPQGAEKP